MRLRGALVCVALSLFAVLAAQRGKVQSQQSGNQAPATSSLELGPAFDRDAQAQFEQQLAPQDVARLVRLSSRLELADAACPMPLEARRPFYVRLNRDLTREFAVTLAAAGAGFIGYCWPNTHIVRASDQDSLSELRQILRGHPMVEGTLPQRPEDVMDAEMFSRQGDLTGEYNLLVWRDTPREQASELLTQAGAAVLEGKAPHFAVRLPDAGVRLLLESEWVEQIAPRHDRQTTNAVSTAMSNANQALIGVAPYSLDGNGQVAGVWDEGHARLTHEQYTGLAGVSAPSGWPSSSRIYNVGTSTLGDHSAHVTGTIVGNGTNNASAHGYAPKALCLVHEWNNIDIGRRDARHFYNHSADNHSYYSPGGWGGYNSITQEGDITNRDILTCMVQSAGNSATSGSGKPFGSGNPTCSVPTSNAHRNGFIIGATDDSEDRAGFSSCGPGQDGRLAPQFCANGVGLESSLHNADNAYASYSGTSMSGPSSCGSVVLLSQLWQREHAGQNFTPDVARAVMAQTCRDKYHPGPDYQYGFGFVDCQAAADLVLADKASGGARIFRGTVASSQVREYSFNVSGSAPLHFVLSWLDIWASTSASVTLVNNLDLELEAPSGTIHYPYSGVTTLTSTSYTAAFTNAGANNRDNIELVHVDNPQAGTWTLRVTGTSIPANPQTGVPNDQTGFVIAGSHNVTLQKLFFDDTVNGGTPVNIPDNSATGVVRTFNTSDSRVIVGARVITRVNHERRGDIAITLTSPGNTVVNLKTANNGMFDDEYDVIAVFPDTKQDDDDMTPLHLKPVAGTWTVRISDTGSGNTGSLHYLALELDVRVNNAPVADAGSNVTLRELGSGALNGSASSDPDGDPFTYQWAQTGGSTTVNLNSSTVAQPTFTAPAVSANQAVTFTLTVTDMSGASDTDTVQITIQNNQAPVASAGIDVSVRELGGGQLNATATTDPEGDTINYSWTQLTGTTVPLTGPTTAQPTFTAPAVSANQALVYRVTTTDSYGDSSTDTVQVTILNNQAPVASAGTDVSFREIASGQLNATATTDPEGDSISYAWAQLSGTSMALTNPTSAQPTFTTPAVSADQVLVYQVTATDSYGDSDTDTVQVTIANNLAPQANAGADFGVITGDPGALDATGSTDPEGDTMTYAWVQTAGSVSITLSNPAMAQPTFTAPAVSASQVVTFQLTVTDSRGDAGIDTVDVSIELNVAPVADAGNNFALMFSAAGTLDGSGSFDPNTGDTLTYAWVQTGGLNTVALSDPAVAMPTFTAPASDDTLVFQLTVTDARGLSDTDIVAVWVNATGTPPSSSGGGGKDGGGGGCSSEESHGWWWLALVGGLLALQLAKLNQRLAHNFAALVRKRRQRQARMGLAQAQQ